MKALIPAQGQYGSSERCRFRTHADIYRHPLLAHQFIPSLFSQQHLFSRISLTVFSLDIMPGLLIAEENKENMDPNGNIINTREQRNQLSPNVLRERNTEDSYCEQVFINLFVPPQAP